MLQMAGEFVFGQLEDSRVLWRYIMNRTTKFVIEISSDLDYEEIVANILFEEETVATISQENGLENLEIEIFSSFDRKSWIFSLEEFINALNSAKGCLLKMPQLSKESDN